MTKRDVVAEILARTDRRRTTVLSVNLDKRLTKLRDSLSYLTRPEVPSGVREELLRHFPVAIVATLEGFLRLLIEVLIDKGAPFNERIDRFKDIKLDMGVVRAIGKKTISIGQLVSHSIPLSRLEHINEAFEKLLDITDLWKSLDGVRLQPPLTFDVDGSKAEIFSPVHAIVYQHVVKVFDQRHVLAHELAIDVKSTTFEMSKLLLFTILFASVIEDLVTQHIENAWRTRRSQR